VVGLASVPNQNQPEIRQQGAPEEPYMIQLTRLNNNPLAVNSDLIKFVEQAPDTVITLVNGEKIVVRESAQDVLERVINFRRSVLQGIMLWWDNRSALPPVVQKNVEKNNDAYPAGEK
jgi:flagellar protein FlbD